MKNTKHLNLGFEQNRYPFINKFFQKKISKKKNFFLLQKNQVLLNKINRDVNFFYPKVINNLKSLLNNINQVKFTNKQYNYLIGFYVFSLLRNILGRKEKLKKIFFINKNIFLYSENLKQEKIIFNDCQDLHAAINFNQKKNRLINFSINYYLIKFFFKKKIFYNRKKKIRFRLNNIKSIKPSIINNLLNLIFNFFSRSTKVLIFTPFISKFSNFKLQLLFLQFPIFFKMEKVFYRYKYNKILRNTIISKINTGNNELDAILKIMISLLPLCYLEGFEDQKKRAEKLNWNKNPKCIFTSNAYTYNEIFKMYCAINKVKKIIIGQHGTNYCFSKFKFDPAFEQVVYSKFLSWGYHGKNTIKGFNFIQNNIIDTPSKSAKKILLIFNGFRGENLYDESFDYHEYIQYYYDLIKKIPKKVRKNILVKFHHNQNCFLNEKELFIKILNKNQILSEKSVLEESINRALIPIFTYDNTDFYKCLNIARPTLLFSHNKMHHLKNGPKKIFNFLNKSGIYIEGDSVKLINFITNASYQSITNYWKSPVLKKNIRFFNDHLNKQTYYKVFHLYKLIKKNF